MRIKLKTAILGIVILSILLTAFYGSEVEAADQTAKLKSFLENNVLYYSTSVVSLNAEHRNSLTAFENKYKDNHVTVTGNILYNSVSKNYKEVWLYSDGERVLAKTSDKTILALAKKLKVGDTFTVYGEITGIKKDSFAIDVEKAVINSGRINPQNRYVYFEKDSAATIQSKELTSDGHIVMNIPEKWDNKYVRGRLTNNGVTGFQFYLNAIAPQNRNYAENFYIFYFDYQMYLYPTYDKYTKGDREDIEELIIKNIMGSLPSGLKIEAEDIEVNGKEYDYCSTIYTVDSKTYRLEFVFRPDSNKGLICMLYLYFYRDGEASHLEEAAYLIGTLEN